MKYYLFKNIAPAGIGLFLVCILFSNCAYLNTYYNAKTAYNAARREHLKQMKNLSGDSASQVPSQAASNYERAISKSLKVLEVYPKSKKWHDDAIFLMARATYYNREYLTAIRRFRRLQREFPSSPFIPESYLYLGKAYLDNDNLAKAEETFLYILENFPELNRSEEITFLLARVAIKREGKAQAIGLLEKTLATVQTPEKRMEILLKIAHLYMELRQWENAIKTLGSSPRKRGETDLMYETDIAMLTCLGETGKYSEALGLAAQMLKNRYYILHYPEIQLAKARTFKKSGNIKNAVNILEQITKSAIEQKNIIGEAWLELGLIHQHIYGDLLKAKECYDNAISSGGNGDAIETAKERSKALDELAEYRVLLGIKTAQTDSTDSSDNFIPQKPDSSRDLNSVRYKMGEVFWLSLQEPDSALRHFEYLIADSTVKDTLQAQAMYACAWLTLNMKKDTLKADSLFDIIIKTYPASLIAKRAQMESGVAVTVKTREDSALQAYIASENLFFNDGNALEASRAYLNVAREYPDMDVCPKSFYAAAWLCDNVLNKKVTARKLYKTLCDSFPQSELCLKEAKPRLKIVEDTLNAIRSRKQNTEDNKIKQSKKAKFSGKDNAEIEEYDLSDTTGRDDNLNDQNGLSEKALPTSGNMATNKKPAINNSKSADTGTSGLSNIPSVNIPETFSDSSISED